MTSPIPIDELFTPAPSGVGGNPNLPPPTGSWLASELEVAALVQLPTTSWQAGAPERTILAINAVMMSQSDAMVSLIAQGGFLDFAASGTVTYVALDGTTVTIPVTPDPSIPSQNPDGSPGWLDVLGRSVYDVERLLATYATGPLAFVNTNPGSVGPFDAGTYHVANTRTQATYKNESSLTIPSSIIAGTGGTITAVATGVTTTTITTQTAHGRAVGDIVYFNGAIGVNGLNGNFAQVAAVPSATSLTVNLATSGTWTSGGLVYACTIATMVADIIGTPSNASSGDVTTTITQFNGVGCFNVASWSAANYESNTDYANRCRLKLAAASPDGPSAAYKFFALSAQSILASQTPKVVLTNGAIEQAEAFGNPQTGLMTLVVASASPASTVLGEPVTPGCTQLPVTNATNATPIVITTSPAHGLSDGDAVTIQGVLGNTNANGTFSITVLSSTTFSLDTSTGNAAYTGGGTVEGGDLGQVNTVIQARVVPDGIAGAIIESALALPVAVTATVIVPQAFANVYRAAVPSRLDLYFRAQPIGGTILPGEAGGTIPLSAVEGVLNDIGVQVLGGNSYVRKISGLTLNGVADDLDFPSEQYRSITGVLNVTVVGV